MKINQPKSEKMNPQSIKWKKSNGDILAGLIDGMAI
jgi:hypothetical protein